MLHATSPLSLTGFDSLSSLSSAPQVTLRQLSTALSALSQQVDQLKDAYDEKFDALEKRFDALEKRFDALEKRFDALEKQFHALGKKVVTYETRSMLAVVAAVCSVSVVVAFVVGHNVEK